ncbi:MAG: AAA family ATPase [Cyanobacteria bacterium P01_D01_bin.156]
MTNKQMTKQYEFSLKVRNYKCFGKYPQGFEQIKTLNLILGRNNTGKSSLLDLIEELSKLKLATEYLKDAYQNTSGNNNSQDFSKIRQNAQEIISIPNIFRHDKAAPEIIIEIALREDFLRHHFSEQNVINNIDFAKVLFPEQFNSPGSYNRSARLNYWDIGKSYINSKASLRYRINLKSDYGNRSKVESHKELINTSLEGNRTDPLKRLSLFLKKNPKHTQFSAYNNESKKIESALSESALKQLANFFDPFVNKQFKRIYPDRNILPEEDNIYDLDISGDGRGVTNIIQNFYNREDLDRNLIGDSILNDLNHIFRGDAEFLNIIPRRKTDGKWEVALEEERKGTISLSQSGSSLKTVMILLVYLHLVPVIDQKSLSSYVFLIEELENNLHPSLLRRLLIYISEKANKDGCIFFMATHSNVAIDMFSSDENAQIIHVTHDAKSSNVEIVTSHLDGLAILEDLGIRASDLLQANGIIWVEGPSDVIYIEKWLEMYGQENQLSPLVRGLQYEFQMFGGALLDSLCLIKNGSSEEEEYKKIVSMLSFSRNAFVVIDSDAVKKNIKGQDKIVDKSKFSAAKKYIKNQFTELSRYGLNLGIWYKAGNTKIKTLEEYLDKDTIENFGTQELSKKTKKIYAQMVTQSWDETKSLDDFPNNLKREIESLYQMIMTWNQ